MSDSRLERKFLRAPLKSTALYADGEHVFKASILNVSEGGILLSELPHIPEANTLSAAIGLIEYPRFQGMSADEISKLTVDDFPRKVLKIIIRIMRSFENQTNVDRVFINYIGCEFAYPDSNIKHEIVQYIENYTKNLVYLLSLFESLGNKAEQLETLRTIAHLLGYDRRMKVPLLRAKILHDYQSLESL